jgi:NADH-quinone oxidoreductase subunit E
MLSEAEQSEIAEELAILPYRRAAAVEALKIIQRRRGGWVDDEALADVAAHLEMSPTELEGVATFYNLIFRRPVGRHVILVCDSVSCWLTGYEAMVEALKQRLGVDFGQTTDDGRFTLLPICCLGACDGGPALMIDEDLHRRVTAENVAAVLERYV